jgi:hypothetical protein
MLSACSSATDNSFSFYNAEPQAARAYDDGMYGVGMYDYAEYEMTAEAPASMPMEAVEMSFDMGGGSYVEPMPMPEVEPVNDAGDLANRKLIKNANLNVETEEFDALLLGVEERVKNLGGYMENFSVSNNSYYYGGGGNRYGYMTIRIPAVNYDFFMNEIATISHVLSRNESISDVTLQYVDLESHKRVLVTEQERLIELLARAETIEDIILLEERLSNVRYQIERLESQLRTYDNLVDYSTIYLSVSEVRQLTPITDQTAWEQIAAGFKKSISDIGQGFTNFFIGILSASPYLIMYALFILFVFVVVKVLITASRKSKAKRLSIQKEEPNGTKE